MVAVADSMAAVADGATVATMVAVADGATAVTMAAVAITTVVEGITAAAAGERVGVLQHLVRGLLLVHLVDITMEIHAQS